MNPSKLLIKELEQFSGVDSLESLESAEELEVEFLSNVGFEDLGGVLFLLDSVNEIDSCNYICEQLRDVQATPALLGTAR